jgi:hypothetical protein
LRSFLLSQPPLSVSFWLQRLIEAGQNLYDLDAGAVLAQTDGVSCTENVPDVDSSLAACCVVICV